MSPVSQQRHLADVQPAATLELARLKLGRHHGLYAFVGVHEDAKTETLLYVGKSGQLKSGPGHAALPKGTGLWTRLSKAQSGLPDWWTLRLGTEKGHRVKRWQRTMGVWSSTLRSDLEKLGFYAKKDGQIKRSLFLPLVADICQFAELQVRIWTSSRVAPAARGKGFDPTEYVHPALLENAVLQRYVHKTGKLPVFHKSF